MYNINKEINFGFIIISSEYNYGRLKSTVNSIKNYYPNIPHVAVLDQHVSGGDLKEAKTLCNAHKGKNTITSLMNIGLKKGNKDWNVFVMEGSWIRRGLVEKLSRFITTEKDILYPIITDYDRQGKPVKHYMNFDECTLNGLMIHQKTFLEIGDFTDDPMRLSRFIWAIDAVQKGCAFKGIAGVKIC